MKNYPKSLQELSRRKSFDKVGIVQSPSAIEHLLLIFESYLMNPVSSVFEPLSDHANPEFDALYKQTDMDI